MAETEIKSINGKPIADTTARQDKADKAGWVANKYIGTDENGNLIEKDPPQTGTGGITQETDPTVPAWAKQPNPPKYTASDVGALPADTKIPEKTSDLANDSGYITIAVATLLNYYLKTEVYNKSEAYSRSEVDNLISGLDKRLNAVADSEDVDLDQLSEIVAYIKSNKSLIDSITTSKVSIADIIDNLTTADAKKPLSAAQGKALKEMYDALPAWAKAAEKPAYTKAEVGLGNLENVRQYSASNPPPYPVTSVNGETGAVNLDAAKVGALPASTKIPVKTSDITNDSGFITKTVADLVNYYTKSETYTQAEVNALVSAIPKFAISVVSALPTSGISTTTVYLVKSGTGGDLYTEYIYVGGAWEILGSQKVDLTGYATEAWVNQKLGDYLTADTITAAMVTNALGYTPAKPTDVPVVDSTLTKSGQAADAAIVGQKLTEQSEAIADKANKTGWTANKYIGTDGNGNLVPKDAPIMGDFGETITHGYRNKKVLFLGDSITSPSSGWIKYFNQILSPALFVNVAVSGARYCDYSDTVYDGNPVSGGNSGNVIGNQVEKILRGKDSTNANYVAVSDYDDFDLILIAAGTNDEIPSGDFESSFVENDAPISISTLDKTVFASAVRYAVETLQILYPNAVVFVCTPIQAYVNTRYYSATKAKRDYLIKVCERMSVPYIDTFMCGISAMFEVKSSNGRDLKDGLHPNDNGAKKIAKYNAKEVINYLSSSVEVTEVVSYTNQIPISIDTDGSIFNGIGYLAGKRLSSSGTVKDDQYAVITGYIEAASGDKIRIGGDVQWVDVNQSHNYIATYDSGFNLISVDNNLGTYAGGFSYSSEGDVAVVTLPQNTNIAYIRVSYAFTDGIVPSNPIITVNEEIT